MAYYFSEDSSDDEYDVNLGIRERLHINRTERAMKPDYLYDVANKYSNLSSSLVGQPGPSGLRVIHSKKRQNRDRNLDRSENAKRTCLSNGNPKYPEKPRFEDVLNDLNPNQYAENAEVAKRPNIFEGNILDNSSDSDEVIGPANVRGRNMLRNYSSDSDEFNFPVNLTRKGKFRILSDDSSSASQSMDSPGPSQPRKVLQQKIQRIVLSDESESDSPQSYLASMSSDKNHHQYTLTNSAKDRPPRQNKVWHGRYVSPASNGYKERNDRPHSYKVSNRYNESERNYQSGSKASNNDTNGRSCRSRCTNRERCHRQHNAEVKNRDMDSEGEFSSHNCKDSNRHMGKKKDSRPREYKPSNRDLDRERDSRHHNVRSTNRDIDSETDSLPHVYRDAVNNTGGSSESNLSNATAPGDGKSPDLHQTFQPFAFEARFLPDMILPALSLQPSTSHSEVNPVILDTVHTASPVSMFSITISPLATHQSSSVGNVTSRVNLGSSHPTHSSPISRPRSRGSASGPILVSSSEEEEVTFLGTGNNAPRQAASAGVRLTAGARVRQSAGVVARQAVRARRTASARASRSCRRRCSQHGSSLRRCDARCRKNKPGSVRSDIVDLSGSSSSSSSSSISSCSSYLNASSSSGIEFFTADSDTETNFALPRDRYLRRRSRLGVHRLGRRSGAIVRPNSLSPDPVALVQQVQTDEEFARHLQAQFDAEAGPSHSVPHRRSIGRSSPATFGFQDFVPPSFLRSFQAVESNEASGRRRRVRINPPPYANNDQIRSNDLFMDNFDDIELMQNEFSRHFLDGIRVMQNQNRRNTHESLEALLDEVISRQEDVPRGLRSNEISRLPTREYTFPSVSVVGAAGPHRRADLNKECQVCLSDYEENDVLRILPCFHEFHIPCIDPWLKINRTCPVCRVTVDVSA